MIIAVMTPTGTIIKPTESQEFIKNGRAIELWDYSNLPRRIKRYTPRHLIWIEESNVTE